MTNTGIVRNPIERTHAYLLAYIVLMSVLLILNLIFSEPVLVANEYTLSEGDEIPGTDYTICYISTNDQKVLLCGDKIEALKPGDTMTAAICFGKINITIEKLVDDKVVVKTSKIDIKIPAWLGNAMVFGPVALLAIIISDTLIRHIKSRRSGKRSAEKKY